MKPGEIDSSLFEGDRVEFPGELVVFYLQMAKVVSKTEGFWSGRVMEAQGDSGGTGRAEAQNSSFFVPGSLSTAPYAGESDTE